MKHTHYFRRFTLILFFILLLTSQLSAQEKPMITVLPFSSIEVPAYISQIISQLFETHLVNTKGYDVLSQNERDQILSAQAESLSGCTDESCAIEIGRMLAAEQIILGTVAALGSKYIINAKIIDVTTSKTLGADMISAASVEDLDSACQKLTYSLVAKALPELAAGTAPKPEPIAEVKPEPEPEVAEQPTETEPVPEPVKAPKPKPVREPGALDMVGYLTHTGGVLLQNAGNVLGTVSFGALQAEKDAWAAYMDAETGIDALYGEYQDSRGPYIGSTIASYSTWGAGTAAFAGSWFFTEAIALSGMGRIAYAAGTVLEMGGNLAGLISGNQSVDLLSLYSEYLAAQSGANALYSDYTALYGQYSVTRSLSLGFWALGGGLLAASPFLPGEKYAVAPSFLNKLLMTLGSFMVSAGNFTGAMALNARLASEEAFGDYFSAQTGINDLYDEYLDAYGSYQGLSIATYGLWAAGGIATLVSLFVPFGTGEAVAALPASLSIQPAPTGFGAEIHITLQ